LRAMLAEAWLQQDDLDQAATVLGRPPDTFRDAVAPVRLAALWRLHGRLASTRGDQSRAIALQGRALKQAELAHEPRAIGLAHYELAQCYRQVGDTAIVREHISKAASALHAAGDKRHLALVHSLSSILLAQVGEYDEAMSALRHACANPYDSRQLRHGSRFPCARERRVWRIWATDEPLVRVVGSCARRSARAASWRARRSRLESRRDSPRGCAAIRCAPSNDD